MGTYELYGLGYQFRIDGFFHIQKAPVMNANIEAPILRLVPN